MIFVTTMLIGGAIRVKALPNQILDNGKEVDTIVNIMCDKDIRSDYPIRTIFCVNDLTLDGSRNFYRAVPSRLIPVADVDYNVLPNISTEITAEFSRYYNGNRQSIKKFNAFMGKSTASAVADPDDIPVPPKKPRSIKLFDVLKRTQTAPTIEEDGFYVEPEVWHILMRNTKRKENTMLTGPTGTGKTELLRLLSKKTLRESHVHDMSTMQDPISSLLGVHRLVNGQSTFDYASFPRQIKNSCNIILDELSRAPVTANNILFPCLDSRRSLPVEIANSGEMRDIPVHPDCMFFATANIGGEYTGTHLMDRALLDRFMILELSYMPVPDEVNLLCKRSKNAPDDALAIVKVAEELRNLYFEENLSTGVSHRHTLMIGSLVRDGLSIVSAIQRVLLPLFEGTESQGEKATVLAAIKKF